MYYINIDILIKVLISEVDIFLFKQKYFYGDKYIIFTKLN